MLAALSKAFAALVVLASTAQAAPRARAPDSLVRHSCLYAALMPC